MTPEYTLDALTEALAKIPHVEVGAARNGAFRVSINFTDTSNWADGDLQVDTLVAVRNRLQELGYKGINIGLSRRVQRGDDTFWVISPSVWVNPEVAAAAEVQQSNAQLKAQVDRLENMLKKALGVSSDADETVPDQETGEADIPA